MGMEISVSLIDGQGRFTSKSFQLVNTITTIAAAQTALDSLLADFPGVSGLGILSATLSVPLTVTPTTAQTQSNIDEGVGFSLQMVDGGKFNERIPGPLKDDGTGEFVYITGGEADVADTGVVAYYANFLSAGAFRFTKYGQRVLAVSGILTGVLEKN